jgi:predicted ATPase
MVRELAEALEVLTAERTLVIVLEDLHWADTATIELLAVLARRREPARLLVLGTYRPSEVLGTSSPLNSLVHELQAHQLSVEMTVPSLSEADVAAYLQQRFPDNIFPTRLAEILHRRTDGTPLLLISIVEDLIAQQVIIRVGDQWVVQNAIEHLTTAVPDSIRHLVARQRERLSQEDQQVLAAASVAGMEFSVASVAAALDVEVITVGAQCARLAERQQFLQPAGIAEWPDGTVAARYSFLHALYQQLWHEQVTVEQQQQWHLCVGGRKELAYGTRASEIAAELAVHFEQGRKYDKMLYYLHQAAQVALRRAANPEAINYLGKALQLLAVLPDTPERARLELDLQVALGAPLMMTRGYTSLEVKNTYDRAWELCQEIGETEHLFPVLVGLSRFYYGRNSSRRATELREQQLKLAHDGHDPSLTLVAHMNLSGNLFFQGEFAQSLTHAEQGLALYDPQQHRTLIFLHGDDPEVTCGCWAALALWYLGYPDQALEKISKTLRSARDFMHPFGLSFALFWSVFIHQLRGETESVEEQTNELLIVTREHGIPQFRAMGKIMRGWVLATHRDYEEGLAQLQSGLESLQAARQGLGRPYFLGLLAETYRVREQWNEARQVVNEALDIISKSGEAMHEAELYRLKGELLLRPQSQIPDPSSEAEQCFFKAIKIAEKQQAKSLELRAAISLARLWQTQGKCNKAHLMLSSVYNWFREGFDTKELQEAKALLESLESSVK